ncbi:MAG TPA: ribosomal protein S18-alanine N-acetyltransferase [Methanobacterium sp.]|jgi:ribosomal-protein-alanine N-acetyltransferase|nr:MAG: ribosomal-protein-alanine N-acetyltransferase [Methanobacterium sp.]HOI71644.1 ribosomal protein S18-alanine N-acetyltransferase [Methanobacterium sp.]HPX78179.1 ribosomal protein S18-alanine N-acetyltransferase [Methanobacterium sp.]
MMIREFRRQDINRVLEIEEESFKDPYPVDILIDIFNLGAGFLVAEHDNIIVGYIIFWIRYEDEGHIISIAVDEEHRRKDVGTQLVEAALKIFKRYNIDKIKLEVRISNKKAIDFYNNNGFIEKEVLKDYYEDYEDAVLMDINLNEK